MKKKDFSSQNLTVGQINAIIKKLGGEEKALDFLRGEFLIQAVADKNFLNECQTKQMESTLDFTIRIDRSIKPSYPHWIKTVMHPDLECSGPVAYDIKNDVEKWFHEEKNILGTDGYRIYKNLEKEKKLNFCLNLQDALEIQKKGLDVYYNIFGDTKVYFWSSVCKYDSGYLGVPLLRIHNQKIRLVWDWIENDLDSSSLALAFKR